MSVNLLEHQTEEIGTTPIVLKLQPIVALSDDQFFEFCQLNRDLRIERSAQGELIIMSPVGNESGDREAEITMQLRIWAKRDGTGKTFSSSTGFHLPDGADLSPDASWVRLSRWNTLTADQRKKFGPICPDFVVELRNESDRLSKLKDKMQEYLDNGAELGLLIDPIQRRVHVYRGDRAAEILDNPQAVSCDPTLPSFVLDLQEVWPRD
jgi:Uma2 family endonuclease